MYSSGKTSITAWWIMALMSLFLWYRNVKYDRALSVFVLTLGLVQLIEYGIHSGTDPTQSSRAIFLTLWLQCLVLAIGVFVFVNAPSNAIDGNGIVSTLSGLNLILFACVFIVMLITAFTSSTFDLHTDIDGCINLSRNGNSLLQNWEWLYLVGVFFPLVIIFMYYMYSDQEIAILIIYGALSAAYLMANYTAGAFNIMWCYLGVGFAFLAWFMGMFASVS